MSQGIHLIAQMQHKSVPHPWRRDCLYFFVPPAEHDADVKLYTAAKKWMAKVLECDNISLLSWYESDMCEDRIRKVADIPTSLFMFKKYFQRANPNEKGGKVYTDVMITHTKPMEVIVRDLS